ncbi:PIN domain-containing protein [Nodosilinea sp. E11]|uniref:PIN domain-containing protein n=1 Tax=Nodosilinea sp. E11 TaxID=3037479 RepID=UPI002934ED63|nr:PIN domain-containing protein [Nodosilinea sp. E11]WOD38925.1 PIN domain-containing protein [Nodosilinea sp. E11]
MTSDVVKPNSCFVDSNIWLYAFNRRQDEAKHQVSKAIVADPGLLVSTQVINEVCKNLLQKASFSETQISKVVIAFYKRCQVTHLFKATLLQASALRVRYQLSFWDSLICAAALDAEATILYSEDMQNGLKIENRLTVTNPFS